MGVQSKLPVPLPLSVNDAPAGSAEVASETVPSISVAETPNDSSTFSVVDRAPIAARTGAWLPASFTVIETISESTAALSSAA